MNSEYTTKKVVNYYALKLMLQLTKVHILTSCDGWNMKNTKNINQDVFMYTMH